VTCVVTLTDDVEIVNDAEFEPAGTVIADGLFVDVEELVERETSTPPAGATPVRVTVAVADVPPTTLGGFTVTDDIANAGGGGVTCVPPPPPPAQPLRRVPAKHKMSARIRRELDDSLARQTLLNSALQLPLRNPIKLRLQGKERKPHVGEAWGT